MNGADRIPASQVTIADLVKEHRGEIILSATAHDDPVLMRRIVAAVAPADPKELLHIAEAGMRKAFGMEASDLRRSYILLASACLDRYLLIG